MSAAVIARDPAHQPVGTLAGESLQVRPFFSQGAGGLAVRSASRPGGVAAPGAGSLHPGPRGAYAGRSRREIREPSICKSLQALVAPRATTFLDISTAVVADVTTLFIKALQVREKKTECLGLAHRLREISAYGHGYYSNRGVQSGDFNGSPTQPKRRQAPRGRGCAPALRVHQAGVRRGVALARFRRWQCATRTGTAGVKVASMWSCENCVGGSSGKTC